MVGPQGVGDESSTGSLAGPGRNPAPLPAAVASSASISARDAVRPTGCFAQFREVLDEEGRDCLGSLVKPFNRGDGPGAAVQACRSSSRLTGGGRACGVPRSCLPQCASRSRRIAGLFRSRGRSTAGPP